MTSEQKNDFHFTPDIKLIGPAVWTHLKVTDNEGREIGGVQRVTIDIDAKTQSQRCSIEMEPLRVALDLSTECRIELPALLMECVNDQVSEIGGSFAKGDISIDWECVRNDMAGRLRTKARDPKEARES